MIGTEATIQTKSERLKAAREELYAAQRKFGLSPTSDGFLRLHDAAHLVRAIESEAE